MGNFKKKEQNAFLFLFPGFLSLLREKFSLLSSTLLIEQGEDIRLHMKAIPRDSDPIPLIHVYVDLHLLTLQDAGLLIASEGSQATVSNTARSFREADKVITNSLSNSTPRCLCLPTAALTHRQNAPICL
jgi:hypothetical protein